MRALVALLDGAEAVLRSATMTLVLLSAGLATLAWGVRSRRIQPFGGVARFVRRAADPLLAPLDRRLPRHGVQGHQIPWWGVLLVLLIGASAIFVVGFARDLLTSIYLAANAGARGIGILLVRAGFAVLQLALLVRVLTSWFGGAYRWHGRLAFRLTEWFLGPLRRVLPPVGQVDLSPLVAWFLLSLLEGPVVGLFR